MVNPLLQALADNAELLKATKELILKQFEDVPYAKGASDELLGQLTRARIVGRQKVEAAFHAIEALKSTPELKDKDNPAY
jgi:hypothetical protein